MDVVHARCAGLDVHKQTVVACRITPGAGGTPRQEVQTVGTMTADRLALAAWLAAAECTHVAMESTGVYWKPLYNVLEGQCELLLVNAQHIKQVPGRKTDVRDCEWLADLLRHGLLRASFVPERPEREWRALTRYRMSRIRERRAEVNRLPKTLEGGNLKLGDVASDVLGVSGRERLTARVAGTTDAAVLANRARGALRPKLPQVERALAGRSGRHQQFLLARQLAHIDDLDELIAQVSAEIAERLRPVDEALARLDTIPGVGRRTAAALLAELGTDLSRFPTAAHLAAWAAMCPGNHASAGKVRSGKTRKGNKWLRALLIEAAHAAARTKGSYLAAQYRRLAARRGKAKAAVAVGHSIWRIAYYLLLRGTTYQELGANYFDERDRQRVERQLVRRLEQLGHKVTLEPAAPAHPAA